MARISGKLGGINNALVFVDLDRDNLLDDGEISAMADGSGNFQLAGKSSLLAGPLVATGGVDMATHAASTALLSAPAGSKVINTLTTLVDAVAREMAISPARAAREVIDALNLEGAATSTLLGKNPSQVLTAARNSASLEKAIDLAEAAAQLGNLLKMGTAVLSGAAAGTPTSTLQAGLVSALANQVAQGQTIDFTGTAQISSLLGAAAGDAGLSAAEVARAGVLATDAATVITAAAARIACAANGARDGGQTSKAGVAAALQVIDNIGKVAETISRNLEVGAALGNLGSSVSSYTGAALDALIQNPGKLPPLGFMVAIGLANRSPAFTEKMGADDRSGSVVINDAITLAGSGTISAATVTITNTKAGDELVFPNTLKIQGAVGADVFGNKVLTLTAASAQGVGSADFEAALELVRFNNTSDTPDTTPRVIAFRVNGATAVSGVVLETVSVTAVDDMDGTAAYSVTA